MPYGTFTFYCVLFVVKKKYFEVIEMKKMLAVFCIGMAVILFGGCAGQTMMPTNPPDACDVQDTYESTESESTLGGVLHREQAVVPIGFKVIVFENFDITGEVFNPRYDIYLVLSDEYILLDSSVPGIITEPLSDSWDVHFGGDVLIALNSCASHRSPFFGFGHAIYKTDEYEFVVRQYLRGALDMSVWDMHIFTIPPSSEFVILETQTLYHQISEPKPPFSLESVDLFMLENFTSVFFISRAMVEHDMKIASIYEMYENGEIDELPRGMGNDGVVASGYSVVYYDGEFFVILGFWPWGYREASFRYSDGEFIKMDVFVFNDGPWGGVDGINWFPTEYARRRIDEHRDVMLWNGL